MTSRANSVNATVAFFVVAKEATVENLVWLLSATPANIVVVSYDVWMDDAVDNAYQVASTVNEAVERLNKKEEC